MPEADPPDNLPYVSPEEYSAGRGGIGALWREAIPLVPSPTFSDSASERQIRAPVDREPHASPSDSPVEVVIGVRRAEPPSCTIPWAISRIMERLECPPDASWSLLHQAIRAGGLTLRKGGLCAPGEGPKLDKGERDTLDFDFRRYQDDVRSGGPVGSLQMGRECVHPHKLTFPEEEFEHLLALQMSVRSAKHVGHAEPSKRDAPDHSSADTRLIDKLSVWFVQWEANYPQHSEPETINAARHEFPTEHITRDMIRGLRKVPEGGPRRRGKKPGKSHAEHARRMRA